jgi:hypothetical protein
MTKLKPIMKNTLLVAAIALLPFTSFAQNGSNDEGKDNGKEHKQEIKGTVIQSTAMPVISNLRITSTNTKHATIRWTTSVKSNSSVWYGTSTPVSTSGKANVVKKARVINHKITLNKLQLNTKYYVVVSSAAKKGNPTISSEISFTTANTGDKAAPVISNVHVSQTSNGQVITWNTNEASNSKIYYSTVTPLILSASTTHTVTSADMAKTHSVTISGLSVNTKFYYVIESSDASNNTARTTEANFTTNS